MRTDSELLDGLERLVNGGRCPGILNDDNGHWAVSDSGIQNIPCGPDPVDIQTTFFIKRAQWRDTIREAIEAYLDEAEASAQLIPARATHE